MSINKHFIRLRIATYTISAGILTAIILFLSKIEWRIFFTTYCLPLIHAPLSKVLQPLSLSFNYIKAAITAHDLITSGIVTLNKILTIIVNGIQSILNTFIMLGIFGLIFMPAFTIPILMICTASLGILINVYSLVENIIFSYRNTDPKLDEKLKLSTIHSAISFTMSAIVSASLGVLLFFSGMGAALLLAIGITATLTLITGTIATSLLGYKLAILESNLKCKEEENKETSMILTPFLSSFENNKMQNLPAPHQTNTSHSSTALGKQGLFAASGKHEIEKREATQERQTIILTRSIFQ